MVRARSTVAAVDPQLRHPGNVVGPRATRTIGIILDATRQIFLTRGYGGTTIDEITKQAGVSRASFYTYFPSKRDVLLALGADSLRATKAVIAALGDLPVDWTLDDVEGWVESYLANLDAYGSFAIAWTQAAHEDEEIRLAGMKGHLGLCRQFGMALAKLGGRTEEDPVGLGLVADSLFERVWAYSALYQDAVDHDTLRHTIARVIAAASRAEV
jgi:TetR/AcrR family transcriptional regulator